MPDRTLVASATNLLARGYLVVPTDRKSRAGDPVNGLFAVARAIHRVMAFKEPARAIAVIDADAPDPKWPALLAAQLPVLSELLAALGVHVVHARGEVHVVASYARAALQRGDDAIIVGVDKRYAQLVGDRLWWYDANKDARYTPEIVQKRFGVPAEKVGEWLGLVGDDDALPGVTGIGAKGATTLLETYGSVAGALASIDDIKGRLGNALRAARDEEIPRELARAKLDTDRALPLALDAAAYTPPHAAALNAQYDRLAFVELLAVEGVPALRTEVCSTADELRGQLARMAAGPIALHALIEDPAPVRGALTGIALADGKGAACYVAAGTAAWDALASWLADDTVPKLGHDLVAAVVALRRLGLSLANIAGDSACASHLTQPSNWAPHDLPLVAKHVLGRALPEEDALRGVGQKRKAWSALPIDRVAMFAGERADAAAAIWHALSPNLAPARWHEYRELGDTLVRMELTGILVEPPALDDAEQAFVAIETELQQQIEGLAGRAFNINSSQQLGSVLFEDLKLPIVSRTKTGWSTSIEALERIEHAHPIVPLVLRWRLLRRLRDSWVSSLRRCIDDDGRVHSQFHLARSFSGHLVNTHPDLSRVPGRTPEMARIRRAFVAPPGHLLMSVDFNQLGLHVLAHLTKDPALVEPLRRRDDMHVLTAAAVLDRPRETITTEERQLGKVINFATFAGQGASALALQLNVSAAEAKEYIARFDRRYALVRAFQDEQLRLARERGYIETIAGRHWPIGGLESLDSHDRSYAERLARRATHEGSVADVARRALLEADRALRREGLGTVPLLQVVDEVLFEVPEEELHRAARVAADAMRHAFELEVPLVLGVEAGRNWADLEPVALDA
ncbi:MAG: DNA polymerase [Kofleriaceae bacterium]|nr:DNA polymerase [Kofleriaceae bacterium]